MVNARYHASEVMTYKGKLIMSTSIVTFAPVSIASERTVNANSIRETKQAREARVKHMFAAGSFTYAGRLLSAPAREALAKGLTIAVNEAGITELSVDKPKGAACTVCGDVHDLANPKRSALITLFLSKDKKPVLLSDTCRKDYFNMVAHKALTPDSAIAYRNDFPKAKAR